ncbi:MAG: sn-glycerol-3-phosphate ABC transporter ATP-binding protein UgpC [bacterium]|nr:sn-glycerol-3-phosphate ABC transporter ATP-binding protein UgpC [bacterium]MDT8394824.1 sn-glycerol-3-phosphate ABC transporter ATP-binding protein UgpC [bacterium]
MASLTIKEVHKSFGPVEVLRDISLEIRAGEFLVLVGPSGCGKSTLLNLIAGLETITSGEIYMGDEMVNNVSPKDRDIAMVFQTYALYPNMNVRKNISFGLEMRKIPRDEIDKIVDKVAGILQIEELLKRKPAQLSGGQRQRVAMGRALARNPSIFLFDEPLSNLDAKLRVEMRTEIKLLHLRLGVTTVYVTHDQVEAMTLADRIAIMNDGTIQQFDTPRGVYRDPANLFVAGFIGSPAMNLIPCMVQEINGGHGVQLDVEGGQSAVLQVPPARAGLGSLAGRQVLVGLRPEHISDSLPDIGEDSQVHELECPIKVVEPMGADTLVFVGINGREVTSRVHPDSAVRPGEKMKLVLDMARIFIFDPETGKRIR